jgi:hypothetical protein
MCVLVAQEKEELRKVRLPADPLNKKSKFGLTARTLCRNSWSISNHCCLGDVIYFIKIVARNNMPKSLAGT